jgi:hypothetical protein
LVVKEVLSSSILIQYWPRLTTHCHSSILSGSRLLTILVGHNLPGWRWTSAWSNGEYHSVMYIYGKGNFHIHPWKG